MKVASDKLTTGVKSGTTGGVHSSDKKNIGKTDSLATSKDLGASSKLDLSERVQDIKKAYNIASSGPDVDEAKISKYQSLIDNGKYKVDASKVADRMLEEHMLDSVTNDDD